MTKKSIVALVSAVVLFGLGTYAMVYTATEVPKTYDGSDGPDVLELYNNAQIAEEQGAADIASKGGLYGEGGYDKPADGVAQIIVESDLTSAKAQNAVAAVVFDYRGFDTIGESFILLCAISGAHVILHSGKKKKEAEDHEV